ncbi:lysylphosphatidylglycerol synthase transmembrane domain-containing protein [Methanoculleus sp. MH98A]|uniref:lysylphosphatidylglycerol synthase transmembrane domain-containing protein n=1 Tax=Methanoculleus sp. MH98A TaxID=1495314 RepID=UPI00049EEDF1|nr:lysylphosphatidylglycerol synthase transmembrane domain-containing protein [Methanoculleus sp. MH98A]KDE56465.1 lysylphosphatidylglycerol synthetase [Methanoculleus sp. MH98A]
MWKKVSAVVIPTLIAVGIVAYMLYRVWDELLLTLEHAVIPFLFAAVGICVTAWILRGYRYRFILQGLDVRKDLWFSTACIFISQTANLIVPARLGDFVRMLILKHEDDATYSQGFSSLVVERVFDILMIAVLGVVALPFVLAVLDVPDWFITVIVVPLAAGGVFFAVLLWSGRVESGNRIVAAIQRMLDEVKRASLNPRALAMLSGSSLLIWLVDVLVCYAVVLMFQETIPFAVVVLAIVIGNLVKAVPITPGGVGTYELALALTFGLAGTPAVTTTLIAVIDHLIKNLVTLVGGVGSIYYFGDWSMNLLKRAFNREIETEDTFGG